MIGLVNRVRKYNWCSMMVENAKHQGQNVHDRITMSRNPRHLMDGTQIWDNTPQGHRYWSRIARSLE